mmetsp:Transcript_1048/g.2037  ORF Transcript_1048/g.2037 Transcript_1048/m.2037 type:complete len:198 (+) Transcript_1048:150-743(+)
MSFFEESDAFDGAMREKTTAPKIPPRRRRAPQPSSDDDAPAEEAPAVKKNAGWADDGPEVAKPAAGRRAGGDSETTAIGPVEVSSSLKVDAADDDIMVIPDLEENDEDDLIMAVAEPGTINSAVLPTNLKLDDGTLPPSQVEGIDLSLLYESILPQKQLVEEDESWDPDTMLNLLKQAMQDEEDKREDDGSTATTEK